MQGIIAANRPVFGDIELENFNRDLQEALASCDDPASLARSLGHFLMPHLPVRDRVSLVFLEDDGEWMRIYRLLPTLDASVDPAASLPRVRVHETTVGEVVLSGQSRLVADVRQDPNITFGHASHDGIRSTLSVPVTVGGRVVGALNAGSKTPGQCDAAMLQGLASLAAVVGPHAFAVDQRLANKGDWPTLDEAQRRYIEKVLVHCGGVIEGTEGAAEILGMRPSTLRSRMARLGVSAQASRKKRAANKQGSGTR